jgi:hypothetical protein
LYSSSRQPDGAVAAQGADLQDAACPHGPRHELEELALRRGYGNLRKACGLTGLERVGERRIGPHDEIVEVIIDSGPGLLAHGPAPLRGLE